jgi:hypothetical protein
MEVLSFPIHECTTHVINHLIEYWNPDVEAFMLEGQSLTPATEDMHFLIGLSRRAELINLMTFPPGPHNIEDYIVMYYEADIEKVGSQVPNS